MSSQPVEVKEIFTVFDLETTGLDPAGNQVTEIAAIRTDLEREYGRFECRVTLNKGQELPEFIQELTGITLEHMKGGVPEQLAMLLFACFSSGSTLVAHHAPFDLSFLARYQISDMFICTRVLSKLVEPGQSAKLADVTERRGIKLEGHHRAMNDVEATVKVFQQLKTEADMLGIKYRNVVINDKERPLAFIPQNAKVIENGAA